MSRQCLTFYPGSESVGVCPPCSGVEEELGQGVAEGEETEERNTRKAKGIVFMTETVQDSCSQNKEKILKKKNG